MGPNPPDPPHGQQKPKLLDQLRSSIRARHYSLRTEETYDQWINGSSCFTYPNAAKEWGWQYVFPAAITSIDPRSGTRRKHHVDKAILQKMVRSAIRQAEIAKPGSCHTLRRSFATHLPQSGYDIRTVHELLGHSDVNTTMIYTHVLNKGGKGVSSPLDELGLSPDWSVRDF